MSQNIVRACKQQLPRMLFVGAGNIAQSIMKGIIKAQPNAASRMLATAPTLRNLSVIKDQLGCHTSLLSDYPTTVPEFCPDYIFLCVKPQVLLDSIAKRDTLIQLLNSVPIECITISLVAGVKTETLFTKFKQPEKNIVRLMVNTAAEIGATSVFYHSHPDLEMEHQLRLAQLFGLLGRPIVKVPNENLMDVATGVCGSGIAFFYEAIQAISDIGVKNGLTREQSTQVAAQLARSAGEMLQVKNVHPCQLRDEVTSPAGTTIYGLHKWHEQSVNQKIAQSLQASIDRAKELSGW